MAKSKGLVFNLTNTPNKEILEEFETLFKINISGGLLEKEYKL